MNEASMLFFETWKIQNWDIFRHCLECQDGPSWDSSYPFERRVKSRLSFAYRYLWATWQRLMTLKEFLFVLRFTNLLWFLNKFVQVEQFFCLPQFSFFLHFFIFTLYKLAVSRTTENPKSGTTDPEGWIMWEKNCQLIDVAFITS